MYSLQSLSSAASAKRLQSSATAQDTRNTAAIEKAASDELTKVRMMNDDERQWTAISAISEDEMIMMMKMHKQ